MRVSNPNQMINEFNFLCFELDGDENDSDGDNDQQIIHPNCCHLKSNNKAKRRRRKKRRKKFNF